MSRDPLCASCVDFLVAYRPLWLDPSLLPGPSLLDLLAPPEVAVLPAKGDTLEWRSTSRESTEGDAVRLIRLLDLEGNPNPIVSVGDAEILHAYLGAARRSPPTAEESRSALAGLYRYLASREWVPPHLAEEYRLRARTLHPLPQEAGVGAAVSRIEEPAPPSEEQPLSPEPVGEAGGPAEPPTPTAPEAPEAAAAEPAPAPESVGEPAETPPPPTELPPTKIMESVSAELAAMKEELRGEIVKERESVQAWIQGRAGEIETKEKDLAAKERALEAEAQAVAEEKKSVTERLQALEQDEHRLEVLKFLGAVPGMTEDVAQALTNAFPDLPSLRAADVRALEQCQVVTPALARAIRYEFVPGEVEDEQRAIDLREEAQAFLEEGDYRAALECYDRLLAERPEDKVFWFDKAELHVLLEEPEEALQCYTRVLDLDRRNRQAWFERANLLFGMGRLADAVDALREALRVEPHKSADILLKAEQLRRDSRANEAAILYQAILDVDPGNGRAVLGLGDTFLDLGDIDAAEGLFTRALGKEGRDPELLFRRGQLLDRKGRWGAAVQFYNRALALKWDFADAWLAKGQVLLAHGRSQEAFECFEKVLAIDPNREAALDGKRDAEASLRPLRLSPPPPAPAEPEEAAAENEEPEGSEEETLPESLEEEAPTLAEELRKLRKAEPEPEPAPAAEIPSDLKMFVESIEPEREDAHVLLELAELALEGGDAEMALLRYGQALDRDPKSAKAWTGKGIALQQLERYEEALAAYDRALDLDPEDELAKRWRETCLRHVPRGGEP